MSEGVRSSAGLALVTRAARMGTSLPHCAWCRRAVHFAHRAAGASAAPPTMQRLKRKLDQKELDDNATREHEAAIVERFWTACRTHQIAEVERLLASGVVASTTVCMPGKVKTIFDHAFLYRPVHRDVLTLLLRHTPGPLDRGLIVTLLRKWVPEMTVSLRLLMQRQSFSMEAEVGALHLVPQPADAALVAALVEGGADINSRNREGQTPLFVAVASDNIDVVRALLAHRADPNTPDAQGRPPLFVAPSPRHIEALLAAGANLHARGPGNSTALHSLVTTAPCPLDCVVTLLDAGADVSATTWSGETPLFSCMGSGPTRHWPNIASLLLAYGANPHSRDLYRLTAYEEFVNQICEVLASEVDDSLVSLARTGLDMLAVFSAYGVTQSDYTHATIVELAEFLTDLLLREGQDLWVVAKGRLKERIP